jgi:2,3-bisphosphoglycerate-dependent phosphoglycerate mutase
MEFYIFRHGQTDWNKEKRIQGHIDTHLNENGREQAKRIAPLLQDKGIEAIYSSDLSRAFETANIVAEELKLKIIKEARLREAQFGEAEGLKVEEVVSKFGEDLWKNFHLINQENYDLAFPDGESRGASVDRMKQVVNEIVANEDYKIVALSTHGGVIRNLLHSFNPDHKEVYKVGNCSVFKVVYDSGQFDVSGPF